MGVTHSRNAEGELPPLQIYSRDFLLSRRAFSTEPDYAIPDVCSKSPKPRKRGMKGGVRQRLKKANFRTPLPVIVQGNVQSIRNTN